MTSGVGLERMSGEEYRRKTVEEAMPRVEDHVRRMLVHLDPTSPRQGTDDTPKRVAKMWLEEMCAGYRVDIPSLFTVFDSPASDMVIVKDIPVVSSCEHHLLPFTGYAHVGYLPDKNVVGLSKIKRVVDAYGKRLQLQERLTQQVADAMMDNLCPRGVMVVIEAEHLCQTIRGVQAPGTKMVTSAVRGLFNENKESEKEEFLRLIGK